MSGYNFRLVIDRDPLVIPGRGSLVYTETAQNLEELVFKLGLAAGDAYNKLTPENCAHEHESCGHRYA